MNKTNILALLLLPTLFVACKNNDYLTDPTFGNVVYLDVAQINNENYFIFKRTLESTTKELSAMLAFPADRDVDVSIAVDPALATDYNRKHDTNYTPLDPVHYSLTTQNVRIAAGEIESERVVLQLTLLTDLEFDAKYLLPVTITTASGGMKILEGLRTIWYVISRSGAIISAVSLQNNYFEIFGFDNGSPTADVVNGMKQMTFEAIVRVNKFENVISSIMGIEQYCLLRLGDVNFPRRQLMFCSPGDVKFPVASNDKQLDDNTWYHVALTYDTENKKAVMYVDGQEQSRIDDFGNGAAINLGKQTRGRHHMFKIGHSYGEPEDYVRHLDGEICEVRVWNVLRTQQEIWENMYGVDPQTPGLQAYWKFDEGEGDQVADRTGNGNDAFAHNTAVWAEDIEVPRKNRTE